MRFVTSLLLSLVLVVAASFDLAHAAEHDHDAMPMEMQQVDFPVPMDSASECCEETASRTSASCMADAVLRQVQLSVPSRSRALRRPVARVQTPPGQSPDTLLDPPEA